MTDRLVRTTPKQELGHPSNKAMEAITNYVNTEVFIQTLEPDSPDTKGFDRLIKETREQQIALIDTLTPAEKHFYNEIKTVLDKNSGEDINEVDIQNLKRSGFSEEQVQDIQRLMRFLQKPR